METTLRTPQRVIPKGLSAMPFLDSSVIDRIISVEDFVENFSHQTHLTPAETFYHHEYETHEMKIRSYVIENMDDEDDEDDEAIEAEELEDDNLEEDDYEEDVDEIEEDIDDLDPEDEEDEEDF